MKKIVHAVLREPLDVGAAAAQLGDVADRHAVDALHHHHVRAAVVPVHDRARRAARSRRSCAAAAPRWPLRASGRARRGWSSRIPARPRPAAAGAPRASSAGEAGERVQHLDVALDLLAHPGPQDLDDDVLAGTEPRGVHLRDRGSGERGLVELFEHFAHRAAEALSTIARASAPGNGGTRSCSFASSSAIPSAAGRGAWTAPGRTSRRSGRVPRARGACARRASRPCGARTRSPATGRTRSAAAGAGACRG